MLKSIIAFFLVGIPIFANCIEPPEYKNAQVQNNNSFAFELFKQTIDAESNGLISPLSISTALAMTYEGARGRTAVEMRKTLNFNKNRDIHHTEFTQLLEFFADFDTVFLHIANALIAQEDYTFAEDYFRNMEAYRAQVQYANFRNDLQREAARKALNNWVYKQTNNKIEDLLKANHLNSLTRLVLVNAIHFKLDWLIAFPEKRTRQMIFYSTPKQSIVPYMHSREKYSYTEDSICQIIELAYKDSLASMLIFLPKNNISNCDFIKEYFTHSYFSKNLSNLIQNQVDLLLPKFSYVAEYELKEPLKNLGMLRAFNHSANFKGISGNRMLMIDQVVHKTFIEVNESGTEAAGATAVIIREKNAPIEKPIFFNANRPFVYVIRENLSGSILFMGSLMQP
jgi:serpin B